MPAELGTHRRRDVAAAGCSRAVAELGDVADGGATTEIAADRCRSIPAALDGKGCEVGALVQKGHDLFGLRCRLDKDVARTEVLGTLEFGRQR
jgi:hypothetical protein